jgi:CDP-4-dehydro-6-deoxyglucose reductase
MPDPKYLKPWHGVPRETIDWHPTVDEAACIGCGTCVTGCSRLVYRFDFARAKSVVADPLNCMVGCTTCANTCPTHAIHFPPLENVFALERQQAVRHAIEDDLIARREQLGWADDLPHPDRMIAMRVRRVSDPGPRTRVLELEPVRKGDCFCEFMPGQYVEVWATNRPWVARAYSIGNAPRDDGSIELQLRRVADGRMTKWLFDELKLGDVISVRGPMGRFTLRSEPATPLVFVAGGTAFAPVKALLEQRLRLGQLPQLALVWGARASEDFYEVDLVASWLRDVSSLRVVLAVEEPGGNLVCSGARIITGNLVQGLEAIENLPGRADAYIAGPGPAVDAAIRHLVARGLGAQRIFIDSFGA